MPRLFFKTKQQRKAEAARRERERLEKRQDRDLQRLGRYLADRIARGLAQMGIVHELPARRRPTVAQAMILRAFGIKASGRQLIEFIECHFEPNAIYLRIDPLRIPYPHNLDDISNEAVLKTLSTGCGRKVEFINEAPENGAWYAIFLNGAVAGIPRLFRFRDALLARPASAPPLWYVVGVTQNRRMISDDLSQMPNWLIAGSTRSGKTVHLRSFLLQILNANSPADVQLLLVDLKGGVEFKAFKRLPHLWQGKPIVAKSSMLISALRQYFAEMKRRQELLQKSNLYDIRGWNMRHPEEKWPYLLLIIDELAQAMLETDRKFARKVERYLSRIMAICGATGGDVILCTQRPDKDTVKGSLKTNMSGRTCFAVPDYRSSMLILDTGDAAGINHEDQGRAIHIRGAQKLMVQTPKVTNKILAQGVKHIIHKWRSKPTAQDSALVGIAEVMDYALVNLGGSLSRRQLLAQFSRRGLTRPKLEEWLADFDGQPIEINGQLYQIMDFGPPKGKRLVHAEPVNAEATDTKSW